nr:hypothetical protein [Tanacetum cinerariifolium]
MVNSDDNPSLNNNFNHPGMTLTSTPFNRSHFLGWSRTIKMALGAKLKLEFIDGSSPKPAVIHNDYQRWVRCDYMDTCWILNSMVAELSESFLYAQFTSDLWKELEARYGQSNGPLIYHVERELSKVTQGNSTVAAYFNKLKKFWDELHSLNGVPVCNCGKMRECTCGVTEKFLEIDSSSYIAKETPFDFEYENRVQNGKIDLDQRMVAAVCQEVMKMFKGKDSDQSNVTSSSKPHAGTFFYGCKPYSLYSFHVSLNTLSKYLQLDIRIDWIVDTGASDHMSPYLHLFQSIRILKKPIRIKLPDGTSKWVDKVGHIQINSSLILHNVFYVPEFKVNLLSVGKLLKTQSLIAIFLPTMFLFQDPSTKKVLAVGEGFNNLYICKPSSSSSIKQSSFNFPSVSSFVNKDIQSKHVASDMFHAKLGHTSVSKLVHVGECNQKDVAQLSYVTVLLAKQHRLPFSLSHTKSLVAFELIHVDVWCDIR